MKILTAKVVPIYGGYNIRVAYRWLCRWRRRTYRIYKGWGGVETIVVDDNLKRVYHKKLIQDLEEIVRCVRMSSNGS